MAKLPPAPAKVHDVFEADVIVTVPSCVVVPEDILLTTKAALLVVFVTSYATAPAKAAGTVIAHGIGTLTVAAAVGFEENGNDIGTCCTSIGS